MMNFTLSPVFFCIAKFINFFFFFLFLLIIIHSWWACFRITTECVLWIFKDIYSKNYITMLVFSLARYFPIHAYFETLLQALPLVLFLSWFLLYFVWAFAFSVHIFCVCALASSCVDYCWVFGLIWSWHFLAPKIFFYYSKYT